VQTARIHITGAAGSGVSTLGRVVAEKLGGIFLDTDDFYWLPTDPPYGAKREPADRVRLIRDAIHGHDCWVLGGSLDAWGNDLVSLFDLVVFLYVATPVRLARLRMRERERFGEAALAPGGSMHEHHQEFLTWAASYDDGRMAGRNLPRHKAWLAALSCPVLELDGGRSIAELVESVSKFRTGDKREG
jgi:adenylate kinase family enzyme